MVKPLDRMGDREREVVEQRAAAGYTVDALSQFAEHESVLRELLDRLLPGVPSRIDLAAFIDRHAGRPMGRGDRAPGEPVESELLAAGLRALHEAGFARWDPASQRALISRMRRGDADEELGMPAKLFVDRLLDKALTGYMAHPDIWTRIGFNGPAYPEGYAWIGPSEALARRRRAPGWDKL
jgi:hypothetical protein